MLRGPLHNAGVDGRCEACGEPFPCSTRIAIFEAVKRELEHPTQRPVAPAIPAPPIVQPTVYAPKWEDLDDRADRCPQCLHWWVSHGAEPDPEGCGMPTSTMDERERGEFEVCGCQQRPEPGLRGTSAWRGKPSACGRTTSSRTQIVTAGPAA